MTSMLLTPSKDHSFSEDTTRCCRVSRCFSSGNQMLQNRWNVIVIATVCFWLLKDIQQGTLLCENRYDLETDLRFPLKSYVTPILWPPDAKIQFIGKDPSAGKDWKQGEEGTTEDEMVGWYHWLNGCESEQTLGGGKGQGSLACFSPWGRRVRHNLSTEQ